MYYLISNTKNQLRTIAFAVFALCLFLFSCQTKDTPKTDAVLDIRLEAKPDFLNPMLTVNAYSLQVCDNIFPKLLDYDSETLELVPVLATTRPDILPINSGANAGGLAITYQIRPEAKWPNGSPVLAKDYIFTLKALFNPHVNAAPWRAYLSFIRDVKLYPEDPRKFTVITRDRYLLSEEASGFYIYPEYVYDPEGLMAEYSLGDILTPESSDRWQEDLQLKQFATQFNSPAFSRDPEKVVSCGAYELTSWDQRIILTKKTDWWGEKIVTDHHMLEAFPEKITYSIIEDANTALAALQERSIDVVAPVPAQRFIDLKNNTHMQDLLSFYQPASLKYYYFGYNTRRSKLADKRVRRALAHLIDMDQIIKSLSNGLAQRIHGPFHPSKRYYHPDLKPIPFDPERADKLLDESGWIDSDKNGIRDKVIDGENKDLELTILLASASTIGRNVALQLRENAQNAGVKIELQKVEFSVLRDQLARRDFDIFSLAAGQGLGPDDPRQFWHTASDVPRGGNRTGFGNEQSDRIIDSIRYTMDAAKRHELYLQLQEIIYEEQPCIFLMTPLETIAINKDYSPAVINVRRPGYREGSMIVQDAVN